MRPRGHARPARPGSSVLPEYSEQPCFVGSRHVGRERLASFTALEVTAKHPFDVGGCFLRCHLQTPELPPEFRIGTHLSPEVNLEGLEIALRRLLHHALEADVGD